MSTPVRDAVTTELAALRGADRRFGAEEMHRSLALARLLCLSHGEGELSLARWRQVRALEAERTSRVAEVQAGRSSVAGPAASRSGAATPSAGVADASLVGDRRP
jgi:hypothetical protein